MTILQDILHTHGGLIAVACIVAVFSLIGWVCDEWARRKGASGSENASVMARPDGGPNT